MGVEGVAGLHKIGLHADFSLVLIHGIHVFSSCFPQVLDSQCALA